MALFFIENEAVTSYNSEDIEKGTSENAVEG